ncbi:hypothetical protein [Brevundimonas olei]|uniref:hypothetical protein n=1 Tax=Brevundimonas olei TaxID=657642 RepID=UPI0031D04042
MAVYLWTCFVLHCIALISSAVVISANKTTVTKPSQRGWAMLIGFGFLVWTGSLLFGGAQ